MKSISSLHRISLLLSSQYDYLTMRKNLLFTKFSSHNLLSKSIGIVLSSQLLKSLCLWWLGRNVVVLKHVLVIAKDLASVHSTLPGVVFLLWMIWLWSAWECCCIDTMGHYVSVVSSLLLSWNQNHYDFLQKTLTWLLQLAFLHWKTVRNLDRNWSYIGIGAILFFLCNPIQTSYNPASATHGLRKHYSMYIGN